MGRRKSFVPPPVDPIETWACGHSSICRECGISQCTHRCACHPALSTDKCPKCGGEFWLMLSIIDWEGTEEQYKLVRERLAPLGLDFISPCRVPVKVGPTWGTEGENLTAGRGFIIAPADKPVTVTMTEGEGALIAVLEDEAPAPVNVSAPVEQCINNPECGKQATWIRHTQFAGDHPFCTECAEKEKDFGKDDDCTIWEDIKLEQLNAEGE